jgi:hypothetical protein
VDERLSDGRRIAELLASELDGLGDGLAGVEVSDADRDATPTPEGAYAYRVTLRSPGATAGGRADDDRELAVVFVQPDRARVEFVATPDVAADAAADEGLRVRPKAVRPPRTLVFVEDGASVKRGVAVFEAVVAAVEKRERDAER